MIEPAQEQANWQLLDGLLAQTLLASLPRLDAAGPEGLQRLAQDIESCASDQLRPRLRLVEEKIIPAQLVGGPAKMGLIDFACPSRRAPEAKWRCLLTLNNRTHGAEVDFFEDYDTPVARVIPLGVGTWAGLTSANSDRSDGLRRTLGRPRSFALSATASHFAVALDRTLEIHCFPSTRSERVPEQELFPRSTIRRWEFDEAIHWIEFDRVVEGLVVVQLGDGRIVAIEATQNRQERQAMPVAGFTRNHRNRIVGVADRTLWLCDGMQLSRVSIGHRRIQHRLPLPGKGDSEHLMTMSADGVWGVWVEPWSGTNWRLKLDSETSEPEPLESPPHNDHRPRYGTLHDHRAQYATKSVFITSDGAILTVNRAGQLMARELTIRLVLKRSDFPSDFKAIISADEKRMFWEVDGSFQSVNLTKSNLLGGSPRLLHETNFDDDVASSSGIFRADSIMGRFHNGVATLWLPSGTPLPKSIRLVDIFSVESAGNYLFALLASKGRTELSIIDTRNHVLLSWHKLNLAALLSAHDSGQVIAVIAETREIRVIGVETVLPFSIRVPPWRMPTCAAWSGDGRLFAVEASDPSGIAIVEAATRTPVQLWNCAELPSGHGVSALALSQDGEVFVGTDRGWIGRYSSKSRRFDWLDTHSRREVKTLLLLEREQRLLAGNSATLRLYDLEEGSLIAFLGNPSRDSLVDTVRNSLGTPQIRVTTLDDATIREQTWSIEEESHGR